jgi:hypothetical protein
LSSERVSGWRRLRTFATASAGLSPNRERLDSPAGHLLGALSHRSTYRLELLPPTPRQPPTMMPARTANQFRAHVGGRLPSSARPFCASGPDEGERGTGAQIDYAFVKETARPFGKMRTTTAQIVPGVSNVRPSWRVVAVAAELQGLLEPGSRSSRAKDSERLSAGRRLDHQPYFPAHPHTRYVFCRGLPVSVGAPTL